MLETVTPAKKKPGKKPGSFNHKTVRATQALVALTESGLTPAEAGRVVGLDKQTVEKALSKVRLEMAAEAGEYARLHKVATEEAAKRGKAEPAQWMLERFGVVQPPVVAAPQGGGVKVMIGINLPGLSPEAAQTITVNAADGEVSG